MIKFKEEEIRGLSDEELVSTFLNTQDKLKENISTFPSIRTVIHQILFQKEKLSICVDELIKRSLSK